ncbi:hypothetical protein VW37_004061 [Salmonella enterica subsp. houtenae serovar 51:z4,z23:-]|nr:hypothetical protein [Salmonella enterica subsp. houtenae serovar 51:z4,z23:-]
MTSKNWNYDEITRHAEHEIKLFIEHAIQNHREYPDLEKDSRAFAYGVFCLWDSLTEGYRTQKDKERLEALMKK